MSRTYREIPDSGFRDSTTIEIEGKEVRLLCASEEKKGINNHTKIVRDKDNHGCTYSKPKDFKQIHKRRYRSRVNDELNKLSNELYRYASDPEVEKEPNLPNPKEFQPYYW